MDSFVEIDWLVGIVGLTLLYRIAIQSKVKRYFNHHSGRRQDGYVFWPEEDRNRTINYYYRMNLDQTVDNKTTTRAYNVYLKKTAGSKQSLTELLNKNQELNEH